MGQSSKHPCPNLKKPTEPASTTAITMIFFPCFNTAKGLGLVGGLSGAAGDEVDKPKSRRTRSTSVSEFDGGSCDVGAGVDTGVFDFSEFDGGSCEIVARVGTGVFDSTSFPDLSGIGFLFRGCGGGSSGSSENSASNSRRVGIGVVWALQFIKVSVLTGHIAKGESHLMTTTWKSGSAGAVFLKGVIGL
jgi:hypothetical protein